MKKRNDLGIYVHVPFCIKKCDYCDFYSICETESESVYLKAVNDEIEAFKGLISSRDIESLFFGGGTPTAVSPAILSEIVDKIQGLADISDSEISMETNPETINYESLKIYRAMGVNRLSIGLQSTDDKMLGRLGRVHDFKKFLKVYDDALRAGFKNINIDFIIGGPQYGEANLVNDLKWIEILSPQHVSFYSLIIEEGTPMFQNMLKGEMETLDEESDRHLVHMAEDELENMGYSQYEISNFARKGMECRHNLRYWKIKDYLGLGPSAHSSVDDKRFFNERDLKEYAKRQGKLKYFELEEISPEDRAREFIIMGLRLNEGFSTVEMIKYGVDFDKTYGRLAEELSEQGLISYENERVKLTRYGRDILNRVEFLFYNVEI